ncbi:hypothetical protein B4123_1582 [Bacillus paralicheniformis]|nr:hypothetical protein SC10_B2orf03224 [Bacillus paralicheniformis]OLG11978.1 hypothetical protein B4123_1582 [Bacillus paralicheniformis]TWJ56070.1 hypothetical protein CHCC5022_1198 [Bacillus paralicheniformis]TWJ62142.1 hypothetical protein CHCC5021_1609 [Bacillus paralicheniformis]TWJ69953.1 hypothetical protein CHCC5019_2478 [Bacillus paralicheniformis]
MGFINSIFPFYRQEDKQLYDLLPYFINITESLPPCRKQEVFRC